MTAADAKSLTQAYVYSEIGNARENLAKAEQATDQEEWRKAIAAIDAARAGLALAVLKLEKQTNADEVAAGRGKESGENR